MYTGHTIKSGGQNAGDHYGLATWVAWGRKPNHWAFNINHTARQSLIFFRLIQLKTLYTTLKFAIHLVDGLRLLGRVYVHLLSLPNRVYSASVNII